MSRRKSTAAVPHGPGGVVPTVVVTDLDGTLLHHETYRFDAALPAVEALREQGIPLILCSSKTRSEMLVWQERLEIGGPLIFENGGGIEWMSSGETETIQLGAEFVKLVEVLERVARRLELRVVSFNDLTDESLAELTGLSPEEARLAKKRRASLPFLVRHGHLEFEAIRREIERRGFQLTAGGRFWHLTGDHNKGKALSRLLHLYEERTAVRPYSVALGDSRNDLEMLRTADEAIRIPNPGSGAALGAEISWAVEVRSPAPEGWRDAVSLWLERRTARS